MEANEIVRVGLLEEAMEGMRYPNRIYPLAVRPKINASVERAAVSRPVNLLEILPVGLHPQQQILHGKQQRERAEALLRLCSAQGNLLVMPIHDGFRDNMPDFDLLILEIDGVPFEPYDLLSAEAIVASHHHGELKLSPPHLVKEFLHLIKIVEMREEGFLFGFSATSATLLKTYPRRITH